jgi:hypothetical protein
VKSAVVEFMLMKGAQALRLPRVGLQLRALVRTFTVVKTFTSAEYTCSCGFASARATEFFHHLQQLGRAEGVALHRLQGLVEREASPTARQPVIPVRRHAHA